MARGFHRRLLVGASLIALAAIVQPASAQNLVNPSGSTVPPGFIKVDPGETFDNVFNFGTITGNGALGAGIEVEGNGAVLFDVRNRGTGVIRITGQTGTGIHVYGNGASIGDDVDNFGLIQVDATEFAYGIRVEGTNQFVGGDVANRGEGVMLVSAANTDSESGVQSATATATDASAVGIWVTEDVTGIDDVANFGVLRVEAVISANAVASDTNFAFASASLVSDADAWGMFIEVTSIEGDIINAGRLEVDAVAHAAAIAAATGPGASVSLGQDSVTASARAVGIEAEVTTISGGFANVGVVDVDARAEVIDHGVANATTGDAAAYIDPNDSVTRFASASATGVYVHGFSSLGGVLNLGSIDAQAQALIDIELTANAQTGNALAYIDGTDGIYLSAYAEAYGLYVTGDTIAVGVLNAGDVAAVASAVVEVDVAAIGDGDATAYIRDTESTVQFYASATASGVYFDVVRIDGDFVNQGDIDAHAIATIDVAVGAEAGVGDAAAYISAYGIAVGSHLSATATASAIGLFLSVTTVAGDIENSGDIDVSANAAVVLAVSASAADGAASATIYAYNSINIIASASATGASLTITTVDGNIENSGNIIAIASAAIDLDVAAHAGSGAALAQISTTDTSIDMTASASAKGILIDVADAHGNVSNSGLVGVGALASIDVSVAADATDGDATAHFNAGSSHLNLSASASAIGISVSITTIDGDITNSGDAQVVANAAIVVGVSANAADGEAVAYITGSDISFSATATAYGLYVTLTAIGGDIDNSGDLSVTAAAAIDVAVEASATRANATAYIQATESFLSLQASASAHGIFIESNNVGGSIINSGDLDVAAVALIGASVVAVGGDGDAHAYISAASTQGNITISALASAYGIRATVTTTISGGFSNSGDVDVLAHAGVVLEVTADAFDGSATASIYGYTGITIAANANATGIIANVAVIDGTFGNSGDVAAVAQADIAIDVVARAQSGDASAFLSATDTNLTISADASAYGIIVDVETLGGFSNSGAVAAQALASVDIGISAESDDGAKARLSAPTTTLNLSANAYASGLSVSVTTVNGDVTNSGDVEAIANASVIIDIEAHAGPGGEASAYLFGSHISPTVSAQAVGATLTITTVNGNVTNSGDITATAAALLDIDVTATGGENAFASIYAEGSKLSIDVSATATGLTATISVLDGDFTNSGAVEAIAVAHIDLAVSAYAAGSAVARIAAPTDVITASATVELVGLSIDFNTVDDVLNSGAVEAHGSALVNMAVVAHGVTGNVDAYISASGLISISATIEATGVSAVITLVEGNFTNSGDVTLTANAVVDIGIRADTGDGTADAYLSSTLANLNLSADISAFGINLSIDTVEGDVSNSGDVDVLAHAGVLVGITAIAELAATATASAFLHAQNSLILSANASAYGVFSEIDEVDGDVSNSGDIHVAAVADVEVGLRADSDSDDAYAAISGNADVSFLATAYAYGIVLTGATAYIGGTFANSGDVAALANAGVVVTLDADSLVGTAVAQITASSEVNIGANATAYGIKAVVVDLEGDFTNSGDILAGALAAVSVTLTAVAADGNARAWISSDSNEIGISAKATAYGIAVDSVATTLAGDFGNSGAVDALAQAAIVIALSANAGDSATAYVAGETGITIYASAKAYGISLDVEVFGGAIVNSGAVAAHAIATVDLALTADGGEGNALAYMSANNQSININASAFAYGLTVAATTINGGVDNSGAVEAIANAGVVIGLSAYAPSGQAQAYIVASSDPLAIGASASATGIEVDVTTLNGDFVNSGDVRAAAAGTVDVSLLADGGEGSALAYIDATDTDLEVTLSVTANGISLSVTNFDGSFENSGDVEAIANGAIVVALTAYASGAGAVAYLTANGDVSISASVEATGIDLSITTATGGIGNTGDVTVSALGTVDVVLNASATAGGEASAFIHGNSVSISVTISATGINAEANQLDGSFTNSGHVDVSGIGDVDVSLSAFAVNNNAFAHISASESVSLSGSVQVWGIIATMTNVSGDVANNGDVDVLAAANIGVVLTAIADGGSAFAYLSAGTGDINLLAYGSAYGIEADVGTLDNLTNSGDLVVDAVARVAAHVSAYASGAGLDANAYFNAASGSVQLQASATAYGIFAEVDTVNGNVDNSGLIDVAAVAGVSVTMYASASSGDAHAYMFGTSGVRISAYASAYGLLIESNTITGAVTNSGDIVVDAQATLTIDIEADPPGSAEAYLSTTGELNLLANASAYGIELQVGTVGSLVDNSGDLDVSAVARIDVTLNADAGVGSGKAFLLASGTFDVTAAAYAFGIDIDDGAYGNITNSGDMDVDAGAAVVLDIHADADFASAASAFINNTGGAVAIYAYADVEGMQVSPTTVGSIDNSGDLDVGAQALLQITLHADASTGNAVAYLYANGQMDLGALAFAHGIFSDVTALGPVSNSGDITATARAEADIALLAHASNEDVHIIASSGLSIYADASAYGIEHEFTTMNGGFSNSGDITSVAVATLDLTMDASTNATISATTVDLHADAHAYGISLNLGAGTINGDVTNSADVVAAAFASSYVSGVSGGTTHTAYALAVAFHIGTSGTLNGDFVNTGRLAAVATAYALGTGVRNAVATAIGLYIRANVLGDVVNDGTIVGSAYADAAYAYGIVVDDAISGSIQNTGIIAAFAEGDSFEEAFSIQLRGATGPTTIEQLDGFIIGDINLDNTADQADTIEYSGGQILGGIFGDGPAGGDELVAFAGVDDVLNITGDISGVQSINVNPVTATTSSVADVELRIGGDVFNSGNLNVNTHGTLVVGLNSDINVNTYRQVPTGTTLFEIAPGGVSGTIFPTGVVLAGTVGIRPQAGLYADNETYVIIDSTNLIGSTYDNVRSTALLQVDDDYSTPTEVHLNVTRIAFDAVGGLTQNQNSVGGALEADYGDIIPGTDFADVVGSLFGLSQGEYQDALDDLAGAEHAQMLKIGAGAIQSIDNALMGRLAFVRGLNAQQMASVDGVGMAFAQVASTGDVDLHMDLAQAEALAVAAPGERGVWARVFGGSTSLDGDDEAPGFDTEGGGVTIGVDHRISPDVIVGLYGGYAHSDVTFDTNADGSVDTYQIGAYGSWASGALHVDGMLTGAWQDYELTRSVDFLGRTAKSDYDGWAIAASAQVGYDIALGSAAVLEPMVGIDYIHLETDGFDEDGADSVDLNVESGEFDSLKSSLGVRLTAQIDAGDGMVIVPTASVAWEHEFLEANGEFTASFDGSPNGTTFDIIGSDDEADAVAVSLGIALTSENMTAFVGYDGKISGDASSHQGTIGIRFGF